MVDVEFIRKKHFVEGCPIRRLSRQLQIARQTMDPYRALIAGWLAADAQAPPKQRHTAKRIYDRLVGEHRFRGGESTVRRYVARLRAKPAEVFIPLTAAF